MAGPYVTNPNEILYGHAYQVQVLTLTGSPSGGSFRLGWGRRMTTSSIAYNASAGTVQTAIQTIPEFSACTVSGANGGPWTVTNTAARHSTPSLLFVTSNDLTGGTAPYVAITSTPRGLKWPIQGSVIAQSVTPMAAKINVGGNESEMAAKVGQWVIEAPLRLGRRDMKEREDAQVMWDGNAIAFIEGQITKPFKQTTPTYSAAGNNLPSLGYLDFGGTLVRLCHTFDVGGSGVDSASVETWVESTTTWTRQAGAFSNVTPPTLDAIVYGAHLYVTATAGYTYFTAAWAKTSVSVSPAVAAFCLFDGKLIRILTNGQLGFTSVQPAGTSDWVEPITAKITDGSTPIALTTFANAQGEEQVYCLTTTGLWVYHFLSAIFHQVILIRAGSVQMLTDASTWKSQIRPLGQMVPFGDKLFFVSNGNVIQYQSNGTVTQLGPEIDQGIPNGSYVISQRMRVFSLTRTNHWLLAAMSAERGHNDGEYSTQDLGMVLGHNGQGWYSITTPVSAVPHRSVAYWNAERQSKMFLGNGRYAYFNDSIGNPLFWSTQSYQDTGTVITPWFNAGIAHIQRVGLMVHAWCRNFTTTETVKVYYQINDALDSTSSNIGNDPTKHWVQMLDSTGAALTINAAALGGQAGLVPMYFERQTAIDGTTKYSKGMSFYNIRFRIDLAGGSADTNTPVLKFLSMQHIAQFPSTDGYAATVLLKDYEGRTAEMMLNDIHLLEDFAEMQPFAYIATELRMVKERAYSGRGGTSGWKLTDSTAPPTYNLTLEEQTVSLV